MDTSIAPPPSQALLLPRFALWLAAKRIRNPAAGERLGKTSETIRRYCLPFGDPLRRVPDEQTLEDIFDWTGGVITPLHFYPPRLWGALRTGKDDMVDHVDAVSAHAASQAEGVAS